MKVSVFGIGYVGAVTSACLADSGHEVIAVDVDNSKVDCINEGRSPVVEAGLDELIKAGVDCGMLRATQNIKDAIFNTDISLICVGTPSKEDGSLNLDYVVEVCRYIGAFLKEKDEYHIVVMRSTCVPGSSHDIAIPALEKASGKICGGDFGFGTNPEFMREGCAVQDYKNPPKIVIGSDDDRVTKAISGLYAGIDATEIVTDIATAEGVKYADNCWHAMKVGFANEIGNIMGAHGLDSHEVMNIFCMDTKLNISPAYLKPGFAFGGSCLPKDIKAICASAQSLGVKTPIFDALLKSNQEQVRRAEHMIRQSGKKKIAMMGLAFKAGTDDLRESPLLALAGILLEEGYELKIYDPDVYGSSRKYAEEMPHIFDCLVECPEEMKKESELLIVGNNGDGFAEILKGVNDNIQIIDLVRINSPVTKRKTYTGISW